MSCIHDAGHRADPDHASVSVERNRPGHEGPEAVNPSPLEHPCSASC
jgi:hypothetical protein